MKNMRIILLALAVIALIDNLVGGYKKYKEDQRHLELEGMYDMGKERFHVSRENTRDMVHCAYNYTYNSIPGDEALVVLVSEEDGICDYSEVYDYNDDTEEITVLIGQEEYQVWYGDILGFYKLTKHGWRVTKDGLLWTDHPAYVNEEDLLPAYMVETDTVQEALLNGDLYDGTVFLGGHDMDNTPTPDYSTWTAEDFGMLLPPQSGSRWPEGEELPF